MRLDSPGTVNASRDALGDAIARLVEGRLHDPHSVLGAHPHGAGWLVRTWQPDAAAVELVTPDGAWPCALLHPAGLFGAELHGPPARPWRVRVRHGGALDGPAQESVDPWQFGPLLGDDELYLYNEGRLTQAWRTLGSHEAVIDGVSGMRFAVWAPNAERVSVVGEWNAWDGRRHPMLVRGASGVWELFVPDVRRGALYRYELRTRAGALLLKIDPCAQRFELRPGNASRAGAAPAHAWGDGEWMQRRARADWLHAPMNIYEVHAGSWRRHPDGRPYSYRELAATLPQYVRDLGCTHIEVLPLTEHPLDESWGYQTTGYFAATSRYGPPEDLKHFIDRCHAAGLGVILDWVPAHFPADGHALARFDGTALYEHEDPRLGVHADWGTLVYNYERNEVRSFLLSSARYWLDEFHFDGLRVDAVASMLYLDYSKSAGDWLPNVHGGRENLGAIGFLRELNEMVHAEFPGAVTIAEESTAWPMVSRPVWLGGLGFSMKWNMGWMHDTLSYFALDPIYRRYHHAELTFGQLYAYTENFVLPLSHDEVVHGKRSLLDKMPGDDGQRFANLRLLAAWQMTTPGKKLGFMGNEFAHGREWSVERELDWHLLERPQHRGMQALARDLNRLYRELPALHELDFEAAGFRWIDCHDADQSILSFLRHARDGGCVAVVLNFTPVPRHGYRLGVPRAGAWHERINTDSAYYGGGDTGNGGLIVASDESWMGLPASIELTLPPLAALLLVPAAG
jgi:1,4-alpha-glucan branching enzyme